MNDEQNFPDDLGTIIAAYGCPPINLEYYYFILKERPDNISKVEYARRLRKFSLPPLENLTLQAAINIELPQEWEGDRYEIDQWEEEAKKCELEYSVEIFSTRK